ncbi:DUF1836 domain-containing protein [Planococcus sp. N028]|uniref:DUF1836 domain-containing protein n=1 Tax=Planococcus shixiaomingii TaxID=3058393 RepID=A0ABT8N5Q1_9BACL|nr:MULTISPECIES: DUF1836 domain-containing protein [unclassified Planococcus (in: firmicutes)]MDN7243221.1 DUF1836 domain-containing protein [Planococcus sp. N028]WKA55164.1 DUF1836 domain-containing protein [Planococcus sp. N022]
MEKRRPLIDKQILQNQIQVEDIPKIDLYIDQVIQLFETGFTESKRNDKEKILTKTMINNYAKGKLFYPLHSKKYSRNHVMLISLIYQMKSVLSINDIKQVLDGINEKAAQQDLDLQPFYTSYLHIQKGNIESFAAELERQEEEVAKQMQKAGDMEEFEQVLLIASLVHTSNLYKRAAEKLLDGMNERVES